MAENEAPARIFAQRWSSKSKMVDCATVRISKNDIEYARVSPPAAPEERDEMAIAYVMAGVPIPHEIYDTLRNRVAAALTTVRQEVETRMRSACVEKVREVLKPYELEFRRKTNSATNMVDYTAMALEAVTLDQQER